MSWYERATIFYDWVRYGEDLTAEYPRHVVQKALDLHTDTLAFCVQLGGYALWPSRVTPKYGRLGEMDLIGELAHLCRDRGLHFVPWWLGTALGVERVLREHPSWQLVGPPTEARPQARHNYVCYNTPYRQLLYEEVREVLANYEVDGIYFDQLPGSCYCECCRGKFQRLYGKPMPIVPDEFFVYNTAAGLPPELREFRDAGVREFCAGIRGIVDEVRPAVCYAQNWVRNQQAYLGVGLADVLLPEFYQSDDLIGLGLKHRLTKAYFDDGPIWGNVRHSVRHDARHHPLRGTRMLLAECVANHSSPVLLDLCAMDFDPAGREELAETFDHVRAMQESLQDALPVRYAALLHSRKSHELCGNRFDEAFEGMYRLLLEHHVPFEIVTEDGVQRRSGKEYAAMVIPDAVSLADETVRAISEAVDGGMGLVASHMTGFLDCEGRGRDRPALAELLGIEVERLVACEPRKPEARDPVLQLPGVADEPVLHYGSVREKHVLARPPAESALFHFHGGFAVFSCAPDCQIAADVHEPDRQRLCSRPFNRPGIFPGPARWPLVVTRRRGRARLVYLAAQADATRLRANAPELEALMLRAVLWAGGSPPLEAPDCPRSVEVRLFHDEKGKTLQLLLVNLTTNPLVRPPGSCGVIRYVTPHKCLRLALRTGKKVKAASSLVGAEVHYAIERETVFLEVPLLDLYESILLEYE